MGKLDFCFTYYDGQAARDKAHLNRLQRGAYDDIISAQRKIGHLTLEDIQQVLSNDYDAVIKPLLWILKKDEAAKYFIQWVDDSIAKDLKYSKTQSNKALERWEKQKNKSNAPELPLHYIPDETQPDIMDPDDEIEQPAFTGVTHNQFMDIDLLRQKVFLDKPNFIRIYMGWGLTESIIDGWLEAFNRSLAFQGINKKLEKDYRSHFGNWLKMQDYAHMQPADYKPITQTTNGKNNSGSVAATKPVARNIPAGKRGQL